QRSPPLRGDCCWFTCHPEERSDEGSAVQKQGTQMNADLRRFTQIKERQRSLKKRRFALGGIGVHLRSSAKICGLALDQYELDDSLITNKPSARPFRPPLHNANA